MRRCPVLAMLASVFVFPAALRPGEAAPTANGAENVALGRPYALEPAPNYSGCRGESDSRDLTDGKLCPDAKYPIWIQQGCVGWSHPKGPVKITIDLGKETPVGRVRFFTAAGSGDVRWPTVLDIEASSDGQAFHALGSLADDNDNRDALSGTGYRRAVMEAAFPAVAARYVRLRALPAGQYIFCEEIEILRAAGAAAALETFPPADNDALFMEGAEMRATRGAVRRRLKLDLDRVAARVERVPARDREELVREVGRLREAAAAFVFVGNPATYRAVSPQNNLHREIFALHGRALAASGYAPVTLWTGDRFRPLTPLDAPERPPDKAPTLQATLLNGERRGAVLNVTNASPRPMAMICETSGPPVELFDVLFVDSLELDNVARALAPVTGPVELPSGMTRQLYLRFHPADIEPGAHQGALRLTIDGQAFEAPLDVRIGRARMPAAPTLETGMWDYLDFGGRERSWNLPRAWLRDLIAEQEKHGITVTFAEKGLGDINHPERIRLADDGRLAAPLDFSAFDAWTEQWPGARRYVVYMNVLPHTRMGDAEPGTPRFDTALEDWAGQWDAHLARRGFEPGRVVLQILDEPRDEIGYRRTREWARPIRKASTRLWLYSNPMISAASFEKDLADYDILSPIREVALKASGPERAVYENRRDGGGAYWIYNCHGGPFNAAPWYYRGQAWDCFRLGATGSIFWSLGDASGNAWNRYASKLVYYAPFLIDGDGRISTKHFEAIREGVQDYEYLTLLRGAVEAARASGRSDALLADAEKTLASVVASVADAGADAGADADADADLAAEAGRLRVWQALEKLSAF